MRCQMQIFQHCFKIRGIDVDNCYTVSNAEMIYHYCMREMNFCIGADQLSSVS